MIFGWLKQRRRRRLLDQPFSATWAEIIRRRVHFTRILTEAETSAHQRLITLFIAEKNWEGCAGLALTEEMQVTIAGWATLLILHRGIDSYRYVQTILVYPSEFRAPRVQESLGGTIVEGRSWRLGEAWRRGPVVLSWGDIAERSRSPRQRANLVVHEFAHQLDMMDGDADGIPILENDRELARWRDVMEREYHDFVEESRWSRVTLLDPYAAESPAEFFAVSSECFFEQPRPLARQFPDLYRTLAEFYRLDPAARMEETVERRRELNDSVPP